MGRNIVSPTSDEEKAQGLMTALYKVDFYKDFFERFKNHRLPRKDLLLNTLEREFHIPWPDLDQCYELLVKNATELGLLKDVGGTLYVRFDRPSVIVEVPGSNHDQNAAVLDEIQPTALPVPADIKPAANLGVTREVVPEAATTHKPTIFISHSKNMKILTQIKSNLEFGGFSYKVAIETETTAIPIPEKIFGMMRDCNCAIVMSALMNKSAVRMAHMASTPTSWLKSALRFLRTTNESFFSWIND